MLVARVARCFHGHAVHALARLIWVMSQQRPAGVCPLLLPSRPSEDLSVFRHMCLAPSSECSGQSQHYTSRPQSCRRAGTPAPGARLPQAAGGRVCVGRGRCGLERAQHRAVPGHLLAGRRGGRRIWRRRRRRQGARHMHPKPNPNEHEPYRISTRMNYICGGRASKRTAGILSIWGAARRLATCRCQGLRVR